MSSFQIKDLATDQVKQLQHLLACDDFQILKKAGGGNSKVLCIEANKKKWAVKFYPPYALNQRDRLDAECKVYEFLNHHQLDNVPKMKAYSVSERFIIMDWIDGGLPQHISNADIEEALRFIQQIVKLNTTNAANTLCDAAEPFLSLDVLISQIMKRYERLLEVSEREMALAAFLSNEFLPVFETYKQQAYHGYHQHQINPRLALSNDIRSLIPADFGFHNCIRDENGRLYFFDFDYFGWDDPVKLLADILWHPKMNLSSLEEQHFINGIAAIYCKDHLFLHRFHYAFPLFGLRWVLILLNEFIPAVWQNRKHAEVHENEIEAKKKQLNRAKEFLTKINSGYYFIV